MENEKKTRELWDYEWEWIIDGLDLLIGKKAKAIDYMKGNPNHIGAVNLLQKDIADIDALRDKIIGE